jgi:ComF family protein
MQGQVLHIVTEKYTQVKRDLLALLFPNTCAVCKIILPDGMQNLCFLCTSDLHYTYFETYKESSPLDELFWGRVFLKSTFSLLYFSKKNATQELIHSIKYQNNQQLAIAMGEKMAEKLSLKWVESMPDCFIPVPLHPKKKFKRGYNQSELLAKGLSNKLTIPVETKLLTRSKNTKTQTKKGKMERWDNVDNIFDVIHPEDWKNKHLCIIDDVITTGATLESCVRILQQKIEGCEVSVVSLAFAK